MCYFRHRQYMGQQRLCRFITIQVRPKDLLVALPQVQRAASRPTAPRREERPMFGIRRREFISLIGGAATAWPLAARAQRRAKPARIGYLSSSSPPDIFLESFMRGMGVVGYGEGRDFVLEARYAGRDYNKFPALAEELLRAQVDVIVAGGPAFRTWRPGAVSVSVVFLFSGDPVDAGIVASLRQRHRRFTPLARPFDEARRPPKGSHADHDSRGGSLQSLASRRGVGTESNA